MLERLAMKAVALYVPIGLLFLVGAWVSIRSGVMAVSDEEGAGQVARITAENLLRLVLVLLAVGTLLMLLQYLVGYRLPWFLERWLPL